MLSAYRILNVTYLRPALSNSDSCKHFTLSHRSILCNRRLDEKKVITWNQCPATPQNKQKNTPKLYNFRLFPELFNIIISTIISKNLNNLSTSYVRRRGCIVLAGTCVKKMSSVTSEISPIQIDYSNNRKRFINRSIKFIFFSIKKRHFIKEN